MWTCLRKLDQSEARDSALDKKFNFSPIIKFPFGFILQKSFMLTIYFKGGLVFVLSEF
jgi:hypothetical protein